MEELLEGGVVGFKDVRFPDEPVELGCVVVDDPPTTVYGKLFADPADSAGDELTVSGWVEFNNPEVGKDPAELPTGDP